MVTARLLTNCSLYAIYIPTPERTSQGLAQNVRRVTFSWPTLYLCIFFFFWRCSPMQTMASSFTRFSGSNITTQYSRQESSRRVISSSQRPLSDNTQHSQQTNIHAPGGIRTHNLSRRAAADLRLRPRGHWDRPPLYLVLLMALIRGISGVQVNKMLTSCVGTAFYKTLLKERQKEGQK